MIMECMVKFIFSDESLPEVIKNYVAKDFLRARHKAVDLINPCLEEWNDSYMDAVNGEDDMKYNAFIADKQNEILDELNKKWISPVRLFADEYADIAGKFKIYNNEYTIHMILEPVSKES